MAIDFVSERDIVGFGFFVISEHFLNPRRILKPHWNKTYSQYTCIIRIDT
jgi:hypothetical protein